MADESDNQPPSTDKPGTQGNTGSNDGGTGRSDGAGLGNGARSSVGGGFGFGVGGGEESPWHLIDPKEVVPDNTAPAPSFAPSLGTRSPGTRCMDPVRTVEIATWLGPLLVGRLIGGAIGGPAGALVSFAGGIIGGVVGGPIGPSSTAEEKDDMIRSRGASSSDGPRPSGLYCDDTPPARGKSSF
jgi:hypothetical protein